MARLADLCHGGPNTILAATHEIVFQARISMATQQFGPRAMTKSWETLNHRWIYGSWDGAMWLVGMDEFVGSPWIVDLFFGYALLVTLVKLNKGFVVGWVNSSGLVVTATWGYNDMGFGL